MSLHRVAAHVLARRRHAVTGRFGLRVTARWLRHAAVRRSRARGGAAGRPARRSSASTATTVRAPTSTPLDGASLASLAASVGVDLDRTFSVGKDTPDLGDVDEPLIVSADAVDVMAEFLLVGAAALDRVLAALGADTSPIVAQIWPEHFDLGLDVAGGGSRVNLGASRGRRLPRRPVRVRRARGASDRPGDPDYWNVGVRRALLGYDDVAAAPDPVDGRGRVHAPRSGPRRDVTSQPGWTEGRLLHEVPLRAAAPHPDAPALIVGDAPSRSRRSSTASQRTARGDRRVHGTGRAGRGRGRQPLVVDRRVLRRSRGRSHPRVRSTTASRRRAALGARPLRARRCSSGPARRDRARSTPAPRVRTTFDLDDVGRPRSPLPAAGPDVPVAAATPTRDAWIIYTSGTTGRSKGAVLTHRSILAAVRATDECRKVARRRRLPVAVPALSRRRVQRRAPPRPRSARRARAPVRPGRASSTRSPARG